MYFFQIPNSVLDLPLAVWSTEDGYADTRIALRKNRRRKALLENFLVRFIFGFVITESLFTVFIIFNCQNKSIV